MDPAISFTVFGVPATKGNLSGFAVRKGGAPTGRVVMREGRSGAFKDWNRRVEEVVQDLAQRGYPLLDEPLVAAVRFYLPRPSSAPKSRRTWPGKKPDLSKLLRAIEDPMSGVLIRDDSRIVRFVELFKDYAEYSPDPRPRAEVELWTLAGYFGADVQDGLEPDGEAGAQPVLPIMESSGAGGKR